MIVSKYKLNEIISNIRPEYIYSVRPETYTEKQATLHGCLPSLLADWDKEIEIVCDEKKNILYRADYRAPKAEQKSLVCDKPNEPAKKGSLSFVLFESPFTSVSTAGKNSKKQPKHDN
jgi:hypothetical protein